MSVQISSSKREGTDGKEAARMKAKVRMFASYNPDPA
jgi:hypothetical protein